MFRPTRSLPTVVVFEFQTHRATKADQITRPKQQYRPNGR